MIKTMCFYVSDETLEKLKPLHECFEGKKKDKFNVGYLILDVRRDGEAKAMFIPEKTHGMATIIKTLKTMWRKGVQI